MSAGLSPARRGQRDRLRPTVHKNISRYEWTAVDVRGGLEVMNTDTNTERELNEWLVALSLEEGRRIMARNSGSEVYRDFQGFDWPRLLSTGELRETKRP